MKIIKTRFFPVTAFVIVFSIVGIIFYRPLPILQIGSSVEVLIMRYNLEDFTETLDSDELIEILSRHYARRTFINPQTHFFSRRPRSIHLDEGAWFIVLSVDRRDLQTILLGRRYHLSFSSPDSFIIRRVIDPDLLKYELSALKQQELEIY